MTKLFQSLLVVIASARHAQLARQIQYLKVENEILRSKLPARITVTLAERKRLVRFASKLGGMLRHLVSIVKPGTVLRWIREDKPNRRKRKVVKRGRRRKPEQIRRLVLKLAHENDWGYTRILGELKKLGIRSISRNTVKRILRENGIDPGPKRGAGTWDEFLKRHAVSLWQCDFLTQRIVTIKGIRDAFVLVFIHLKTRQVIISPATMHPNESWIVQQADAFVAEARRRGLRVRRVQHDRDRKLSAAFKAQLRQRQVKTRRSSICAPNMNAYVERVIQTIQKECLDHFVILGTNHLDHLCREFAAHYHEERPHQSLDNDPIVKPPDNCRLVESVTIGDVRCHERLGGLLKSYSRKAA
jgi:putative transposase